MPACTETTCNTNEVAGADVIRTNTNNDGNLQVVFGCPGTSLEYTLTCEGSSWKGDRYCCSAGGVVGLSIGEMAGIAVGGLVLVALVVLLVAFLLRRRSFGVKDFEKTGTQVNTPAENWGMDAEAVDAAAAKGASQNYASAV